MSGRNRVSRREFVRHVAIGGSWFFTSPMTSKVFADQGLIRQAERAGYGEIPDQGALASWARLRFRTDAGENDYWDVHPQGDLKLIRAINKDVTAQVSNVWNVADVGNLDEMVRFPMLFMHSEATPGLNDQEKLNLREYMLRGGFLYAEDCVMGEFGHHSGKGDWDFFFRKMSDVLREIVPEATWERLPLDHPIFKMFYHLPKGQPHMQGQPHGAWGLTYKGRLMAYLSPSDAHCGWTSAQWFGVRKSRDALKMGVNIYLYAMTH
ncbi:MAG: DUF4159 domain-containing protein [Planctomycetota bacterium]